MNLFNVNKFLTEKLKQSLETLYNLPFYEYSTYVTIFNSEIREKNESLEHKTIELKKESSDIPGFIPAKFD